MSPFDTFEFVLLLLVVVLGLELLARRTTLGLLIGWVRLPAEARDGAMSRAQAVARITAAQLAAIEAQARGADRAVLHPRLLEQFSYRAAAARFSEDEERFVGDRQAHSDVMLAAIRAGRTEVLRLHRAGEIHDDLMHALEHNLDLQQTAAEMARG